MLVLQPYHQELPVIHIDILPQREIIQLVNKTVECKFQLEFQNNKGILSSVATKHLIFRQRKKTKSLKESQLITVVLSNIAGKH